MNAAPHEVTLTFTDTLDAAFSKLAVTDASGVEVSQGKAQVTGNRPQALERGRLQCELACGLERYSQDGGQFYISNHSMMSPIGTKRTCYYVADRREVGELILFAVMGLIGAKCIAELRRPAEQVDGPDRLRELL